MTVNEVARTLRVSQATVRGLLRDRKLPSVHIGRRILVSPEAITAFVLDGGSKRDGNNPPTAA